MTNEEKNLLLKDLCARLPYDVEAQVTNNIKGESKPFIENKILTFDDVDSFIKIEGVVIGIKPFLRPMSHMTSEEATKYNSFFNYEGIDECCLEDYIDWLNEHHFDYRSLIYRGLAFEAPKDMYKL